MVLRNVVRFVFGAALFLVMGFAAKSVSFKELPPEVPKPPVELFNTVDDARAAVRHAPDIRHEQWDDAKIAKGKTIAVLPIGGPDESGDLLAAIVTLKLKQRGTKVVERQVTQALRDEVKMLKYFDLPTEEQLKRLANLLPADYFLAASVTTLETNLVNVTLPDRKLDEDDMKRYSADYDQWKKAALGYLEAMDKSAQIFGQQPPFEKGDQRDAWLLRNSIAKVRRDIENTDFIGVQRAETRSWAPLMVWPDFFNRLERKEEKPKPVKEAERNYSVVSVYGPYAEGGYRPLLAHLAENLPKSPRRILFEWSQGPKVTFQVRQTNASVAFRLIDATTSAYAGLGVIEVDQNSRSRAVEDLAERLADELAKRLK